MTWQNKTKLSFVLIFLRESEMNVDDKQVLLFSFYILFWFILYNLSSWSLYRIEVHPSYPTVVSSIPYQQELQRQSKLLVCGAHVDWPRQMLFKSDLSELGEINIKLHFGFSVKSRICRDW